MSTQGHESEAINVSGLKASLKKGGNVGIYNEAICSTAGGTAAKVTNTTPPSFSLVAGAKILVKFTYAISAENATLQVGSNSAKPIYYKGSALPADLVKAGTSLLLSYDGTSFNIVGDINTDTTYQVMGASGASHASGLVPDTPSTAGTTKYLREDGTWQEPAGQNYSAGSGIDITNNEISVDSTVALKTDLAPAKLGSGIGTCSTSSGTALTVSLTGYELVQNGFVAVTFDYDVPAGATLNVNNKGAKPIIYKGSAIESDVIKADDTVMFCYDGTNYIVTSLGGGGAAPVNPNETVNISLTQAGGKNADLLGATITITDDDTSETLYSAMFSGTVITTEIQIGTYYTVSVETIAGYLPCESQSYQAGYQIERNITFQYRAYGAYIESTDHLLYTSSNWVGSGKTANSVVVISEDSCFRIALQQATNKPIHNDRAQSGEGYLIEVKPLSNAILDFDMVGNTERLIRFNNAYGTNTTSYAAPYCTNYTFPDGVTKGYVPAAGQLNLAIANGTAIDACLSACGQNSIFYNSNPGGGADDTALWSSTYTARTSNIYVCWFLGKADKTIGNAAGLNAPYSVRPFAPYE